MGQIEREGTRHINSFAKNVLCLKLQQIGRRKGKYSRVRDTDGTYQDRTAQEWGNIKVVMSEECS